MPSPGASPAASGDLIVLHDVSKMYRTAAGEFQALRDVSLNVGQGEFVAVVGKSGSGKSTMLNMVAGIDRPTKGEVVVAGTSLGGLSEGALAVWRGRHLGIVFQFFQLLPTLTVVENVMLPMDFGNVHPARERYDRAMALLARVEMTDHADKLPSAVSGGQQQRVAIARALANNPPILLADEPTGNLDTSTAEDIFTLFEELVATGKTIMIVTHDLDLAHRVSRTVELQDGRILREHLHRGAPEQPQPGSAPLTAQPAG